MGTHVNNNKLRFISLVLLSLCVSLYFYSDQQRDYYDANAKPVALNIVQDVSRWQPQILLSHLSTAAKQTLSEPQLEQLLAQYRQFGRLEKVDELTFSLLASVLSLFGQSHINYSSDASFSQGRAHINLTLTIENGRYKIYNFSINPIDQ
ncbi:MAG: hypothetical protein ACJAYG_001004 [Oceanicoccus sp.]|jgi:hypothetical protein